MKDRWGDRWMTMPSGMTGDTAQLRNSFLHRRCPCCGEKGHLYLGPRGAASINALCALCGTRYNLAVFRGLLAWVEIVKPGPRPVGPIERALFEVPI